MAAVLVQSLRRFLRSLVGLGEKKTLSWQPCSGWTHRQLAAALVPSWGDLVGRLSGKNPFWDKNPFFAAFLQENPMLWEKPVFLVVIEVGRHFSLFSL